jgi:SAM-dependent methyltransferase
VSQLIDRQLLIRRKCRAAARNSAGADFLAVRAAAELAERLSLVERRFGEAVALHCGSAHAADALAASGRVGKVTRIEAHPLLLGGAPGIVEPGERVPLAPESVDLIVSLHALHAINDLAGLMAGIRRALRPDGLFIAAFAGAGTLAELRQSLLEAEARLASGAAPRIYPFTGIREGGMLLQHAGLALPVADMETVAVRYPSMEALMRDLRAMGETNALCDRSRRPLSRSVLAAAARYYEEHFSEADGRLRATFNILWLSGWAPHPLQRKPLPPGSAKSSLAKALKDIEEGTPEA